MDSHHKPNLTIKLPKSPSPDELDVYRTPVSKHIQFDSKINWAPVKYKYRYDNNLESNNHDTD